MSPFQPLKYTHTHTHTHTHTLWECVWQQFNFHTSKPFNFILNRCDDRPNLFIVCNPVPASQQAICGVNKPSTCHHHDNTNPARADSSQFIRNVACNFTAYSLQQLVSFWSLFDLLQLGDAFYDIGHFRLTSSAQPVIPVWVQEARQACLTGTKSGLLVPESACIPSPDLDCGFCQQGLAG